MRVALFGSNGMAGHVIVQYLRQQGIEVLTIARTDADIACDITNKSEVDHILTELSNNYDFVINCIGLLVRDSNLHPDRAILINSWWPHYLENYFKNKNTRVIHLSTDCVFDGSSGYYREEDLPTERNTYGRSKLLGEINNDKDITFRMSIIGPELKRDGTGLMNWIQTSEESELSGWTNAYWNGLTTLQLAKCIHRYLKNPIVSGLYHLVNNHLSINKYELLIIINDIYKLGKLIKPVLGPKPINKILVDTRISLDWGIPGDYRRQLSELKDFMERWQ